MKGLGYLGCALIAAAVWVAPAHAADLSGTYVARGPNLAVLLQVVENTDHHLTGRYEQIILQPNGTLNDTNAGVSGATDADTIVLNLKPNELLAPNIAVSGTVDGQVLHLTGGGGMNLYLVRSNETSFRAQVVHLSLKGRQIIDAKAKSEAEKREADSLRHRADFLNSLVKRMWDFDTKASESLPKFGPVEQRYRYITHWMEGALQRERAIFGEGQAAVARSQISVAINQAGVAANQLHIGMDSSQQSFNFGSGQLLRDIQTAEQYCDGAQATPAADPAASERGSLNAACGEFSGEVGQFRKNEAALSGAFAHAEGVWLSEHRQQDSLVRASEAAAQ